MGEGTRVLDNGCGSGEFCLLAASRGSVVSGIDAAGLAREVGLAPRQSGVVDVPYQVPDLETLERAVLMGAGFHTAVELAGEETVRTTIASAAAPFRQRDGSYRFENTFRYLIAEV